MTTKGKQVDMLRLKLRRREGGTEPNEAAVVEFEESVDPAKTAAVVIDMWDRHWCESYTRMVAGMVPAMNEALAAARRLGMQVVFAPSDVLDAHAGAPQRHAVQALPHSELPEEANFYPPPPPYAGTGGCECGPDRPCQKASAWSSQNANLHVEPGDWIVDCNNNQELWNLCTAHGITTLLYMGVATNMCIIGRSCGIRPMTQIGLRCLLVRDLSAAISGNGYDPDSQQIDPDFTPAEGTRRVLHHLERHYCPSFDRQQLLDAAAEARSA